MVPQNALILGTMTALFLTLGYMGVPVAFSLIGGVFIGTALIATASTIAALVPLPPWPSSMAPSATSPSPASSLATSCRTS